MEDSELLPLVLPPSYYDTNAPSDVVELRDYYEGIVRKLQNVKQPIILYQELNMENQEVQKRTKVELVEAMQKLYSEISSLTELIDEIKDEAKGRAMPAALMAKVAQLRSSNKVDAVLDKNTELEALVDEVRNS